MCHINLSHICLASIYFWFCIILILIFFAFLWFHFPPSPIAPCHHHLLSSHLFPWPWSTSLNASTLLPIITQTQLSDCSLPWLLLPFVMQTWLSCCLFYSGQNPTLLNRQENSWLVYCLAQSACLSCCFGYLVFVTEHMCMSEVVICIHRNDIIKPSAVYQGRTQCFIYIRQKNQRLSPWWHIGCFL